ncbi:MAG: hypothetical protein AABX53_01305 [Nanoarchaeota archaeon]
MHERIQSAYDTLDEKLLKGAKESLKAWNSITGKTKSSLSNTLVTAGTISAITPFAYGFFDPEKSVITTSALVGSIASCTLFIGFHFQKTNTNTEKREQSALERGLPDAEVEKNKKGYRALGIPVIGIALLETAMGYASTSNTWYMLAGSSALMSAAAYVMRVENLPPQKDYLQRTGETLAKKIKSLVDKLNPKPA